jgi:tRNA threonylcarbamoyl adenosine modification protein (Sua5/YciO/YrdC/YwlC family)
VLAEGGVVAVPTETVYGLAVRADDDEALLRLRALKGSDAARPLTWHVATREPLEQFAELRAIVTRLAERYWPGPLTLVLRGVPEGLAGISSDGWTGLRLPAHRGTRAILEQVDFPVAATSANPAGAPPATTADEIEAAFPEGIQLLLDGGPCRMGESSGVLAVGPGRFELLREGLLPLADLRRTAGLHIAFCCTGNTCRSPMTEALARALLSERLAADPGEFGFELSSCGVAAAVGAPASANAEVAIAERGLTLAGHVSRSAVPERLAEMDRIYCLTSSHRSALLALLPPGRAKRIALLDPDGGDVPDPFGGPVEVYRSCRDRIEEMLRRRLDEWA